MNCSPQQTHWMEEENFMCEMPILMTIAFNVKAVYNLNAFDLQ